MYGSVRTMFNVDAQKETVASLGQMIYSIVMESNRAFQESLERKAEERRAEEAEQLRKVTQQERPPEVILDVQNTTTTTTETASAPPEPPSRGEVVDVNA